VNGINCNHWEKVKKYEELLKKLQILQSEFKKKKAPAEEVKKVDTKEEKPESKSKA